MGLILAQSTLLGIWAGLGRLRFILRFAIVVPCTELLLLNVSLASDASDARDPIFVTNFILIHFPLLIVFITTSLLRVFRGIEWSDTDSSPPNRGAMQFSIKQIIVCMFAISVVFGLSRVLEIVWPPADILVDVIVFGIVFATTGLISLWAVMSTPRSTIRAFLVLFLSAGLGCLPPYRIGVFYDVELVILFISATMFQALVVIATLAALKNCGLGLVIADSRD